MYTIRYYQTIRGDSPINRFIFALPASDKAKILRAIGLLQQYGPMLGLPYAKKIDKNIYELRIVGRANLRLLYGFQKNEAAVLVLHAFAKKSQKLSQHDIQLARIRLKSLAEI